MRTPPRGWRNFTSASSAGAPPAMRPASRLITCGGRRRARCPAGSNIASSCWPPTRCFMSTDLTTAAGHPRPEAGVRGLLEPRAWSRRQLLARMAGGFGLVGLAGLLGPQSLLGAPSTPLAPRAQPHFPPRAKRVIFLFMNGGPSHVDTFDPKPALRTYEGQQPTGDLFKKSKGSGYMPSPLQFNRCGQSGIEISETLPQIGRVIDDCCVIRSMKTDVPN